jgi:hypothetical protein
MDFRQHGAGGVGIQANGMFGSKKAQNLLHELREFTQIESLQG